MSSTSSRNNSINKQVNSIKKRHKQTDTAAAHIYVPWNTPTSKETWKFGSHLTENILRLHYKDQVNTVSGNNRCLLPASHETRWL